MGLARELYDVREARVMVSAPCFGSSVLWDRFATLLAGAGADVRCEGTVW